MFKYSIVKRMFEDCDQFEDIRITIINLVQAISARGITLEGLGRDWNEYII